MSRSESQQFLLQSLVLLLGLYPSLLVLQLGVQLFSVPLLVSLASLHLPACAVAGDAAGPESSFFAVLHDAAMLLTKVIVEVDSLVALAGTLTRVVGAVPTCCLPGIRTVG